MPETMPSVDLPRFIRTPHLSAATSLPEFSFASDSLSSDEDRMATDPNERSITALSSVPAYFRGAAVIAFTLGLTPRLVRLAAVPLLASLKRMPVFGLFPMAMFANALCRQIILISQLRAPRLTYKLDMLTQVYAHPNLYSLKVEETSELSAPTLDKIEWRLTTGIGVAVGITSYYLEQIWFIYPGFSFLLPAGLSLFEALTVTTAPDWLQSMVEIMAYALIGIEVLREPSRMLTANPAIYPINTTTAALRQGISDPYPLFNRALRQLLPKSFMHSFELAEDNSTQIDSEYYGIHVLASSVALLPLLFGLVIASMIVLPKYFTLLSGYDSQEQAPSSGIMYAGEGLLLLSLLSLVFQICVAPKPGLRQGILGEFFSGLSMPVAYMSQGINAAIDFVANRLLPPVTTPSLGHSRVSLYGTLPLNSSQAPLVPYHIAANTPS